MWHVCDTFGTYTLDTHIGTYPHDTRSTGTHITRYTPPDS